MIVLGSSGVGKTTLVHRLSSKKNCTSSFMTTEQPSLLMGDYLERMAHVSDQQLLKVQLWDTAGQGKFGAASALPNSYFRHARGVILVYDATSRRSFEDILSTWVHQLDNFYNEQTFTLTLVATKGDAAVTERQVAKKEGEWLAQLLNADHFFECSASDANTADEIFNATACSIAASKTWSMSLNSVVSALKQLRASKSKSASASPAPDAATLPAQKTLALTIKTVPSKSETAVFALTYAFQASKLLSPSVHYGHHDSAVTSWSSLVLVNSAERMVLVGTAVLLVVSPALLLLLFAGENAGAVQIVNAWIERLGVAACSSLTRVSGLVCE